MKIEEKKNRIFFDDDLSHGNITIYETLIKIEMIRVTPEHRGKGLASRLLNNIIEYIKKNFTHSKVILSPMPILTGGKEEQRLNLEQLIKFYEKHKFKKSKEKTREEPYLMDLYL